jgi:dTDP-glucose pyrophosphorylase
VIIETKDIEVEATTPLRKALEMLEASPSKIILVIDSDRTLVGTVTDGDFRRAILRGDDMDGYVLDIANRDPVSVHQDLNKGTLKSLIRERNVRYIPVIDDDNRLTGLYDGSSTPSTDELKVPIVLMAGGLGRRLMPHTADCPKPLLPLAGKPILEHIITKFRDQGYKRFYISINYLGHMIEDYFGTGENWGVEISYLRENMRLGTGGALDLLPNNMQFPFLVMNGDLITEMDFDDVVRNHIEEGAAATMCVREYMTSIPFGVVNFHGNTYLDVDEKPTYTHHINAGIYCLSRDALENIPSGEFYDMPTLFEDLTTKQHPCGVHVMRDSWIDIGNPREYESAQSRFRAKAEAEALAAKENNVNKGRRADD